MWPGWNDKRPEISCKTRLNAKPANLEQLSSLWELYNPKPVSWISWVLQKLLEMCLAFPEMLSFFIEVARAAVAAWTRAPKQICSSAKQPSQPFPTAPVTLEKSNFFFSHSGHKGLKIGGFATGITAASLTKEFPNINPQWESPTGLSYGTPKALASATRSNSSSLRPDLMEKLPSFQSRFGPVTWQVGQKKQFLRPKKSGINDETVTNYTTYRNYAIVL